MSEALDCKWTDKSLASSLTVGQEIQLHCDSVPTLDAATLRVEALNQPEYTIRLLKFQPKDSSAEFVLTSYRVGEHQNVQFLISDGKTVARTKELNFKVQSVIDPQNQQAMQPFGPFGPWLMSWPWWYFLILVLALAALGFSGFRIWKKTKRQLEIKRKIKEYNQKFNAFDQFQKTLRQLDRELQRATAEKLPEKLTADLRVASLTYLMMEFEIDTETKSPRQIVRALRRMSSSAKDSVLNDLALYLTELQKEKPEEIERVLDWAGRLSEKVDRESFGIKT